MLKYLESTGKTEEEAISRALSQLGMDRDDVSVELLERAKTGFLGIGSIPAKVRVSYEAPDEPQASAPPEEPAAQAEPAAPAAPAHKPPQPAPAHRKADSPPAAPKGGQAPAGREERRPAPSATKPAAGKGKRAEEAPQLEDSWVQQQTERAQVFLTGLLERMGVQAQPRFMSRDGDVVRIELVGERLGALIGRRGETLDAIQQLTNYTINRSQSQRVRIHLDAEGYRAKREESLQRLAVKVAGKVTKYRRNMMLEPMNAYERHVIHEALQDQPDVTTYSTGTEPNRRIVVAYSKGQNS